MKIYVFENLNYYIGDNLLESMLDKAVVLETEHQYGKQPIIKYDEYGVYVEWVEEVEYGL